MLNQAIDTWENAMLTAKSKQKYMLAAKNKNVAIALAVLGTIKTCYSSLDTAMQAISETRKLFTDLKKLLNRNMRYIRNLYKEKSISQELQQCLATLAGTNRETKNALDTYENTFTRQYDALKKNFEVKIQNPYLCLTSTRTVFTIPVSGSIPTYLSKLYQQQKHLFEILKTKNTAVLLELCKQTQQNDNTNAQQSLAQQQLQEMHQQIEEMLKNEKSEAEKRGEKNKTKQTTNEKQHTPLNSYEQSILEKLEEQGREWYKKVQEKNKQPDRSPYEEINEIFESFSGYIEDFLQKKQEK